MLPASSAENTNLLIQIWERHQIIHCKNNGF